MPASSFPNDPPLSPALVDQHKLTGDEYATVKRALAREPTYAELGVFSVMWSEHCSYKSSRVHLRRLPTKGARVIQGPGENAGVVDIGDGFAAVFKMESHNHPSFIEPYQGAATGVGGILRDVFTMGARPIASLNALRFGRPDHPRTAELLRGVVAGIGGYGNCIGVPTVGGELFFDGRYDGNVLVNAFTCGVARADRIFYGKATGVGNSILYIGAKTGRDGIHGATMASDEFAEGGTGKRPAIRMTMQVGDPFLGKLLLEACLELFAADVLEGIQDMGAAGLTSSSVEMAGRAGNGVEIDLDRVPRRARAMTPYEILLSESQERMLLVAKPGQEEKVLAICARWELDAAVIGKVTDTRRWVVKATPGYDPLADGGPPRDPLIACDIPVGALTDEAPCYDRPRSPPRHAVTSLDATAIPLPDDAGRELLDLLGSPNVGSRAWVWRQYDQIVRGGTLVRPGSDAAVVRVPCETGSGSGRRVVDKLLAFAVDCGSRLCELDPYTGAAMAVAEVCRNLVCAGAEPIGITDCLNFGNPERPEVMDSFARAVDGLAAACQALDVPIVSGNVSLYNETAVRGAGGESASVAILPTPEVAAVGLVRSVDDVLTAAFQRAGDAVLLLGGAGLTGPRALAGSEWLVRKTGKLSGDGLPIDLAAEARLQRLVLELARAHVLASAHDVSDGGLAVALAECCVLGSGTGARVSLDAAASPVDALARLFGEGPSRVVVSLRPDGVDALLARARSTGVTVERLGTTGGGALEIAASPLGTLVVPLAEIRETRAACLRSIVGD
ncbi:MAG TPA: phosphoribosylformylglycinamidine synthase subunit PurL [Polyangiaceae bacterium]|nr:phosphoribosylformylglycinamidine synthase subunit PurL [Polyangiaceae bacterium]